MLDFLDRRSKGRSKWYMPSGALRGGLGTLGIACKVAAEAL